MSVTENQKSIVRDKYEKIAVDALKQEADACCEPGCCDDEQDKKAIVKNAYSIIATQPKVQNLASCCGSGPAGDTSCGIMNEDYTKLDGYQEDADLGLGCGLPTESSR